MMAGLPLDPFYLLQRNEILVAENRQQAVSLARQEQQLRQVFEECRRQLVQKEEEKRGLQEEVERLRAQLLEKRELEEEVERLRAQLLEKRELEEEVERLRAQLLQREQQVQEPEDGDEQPRRKRARVFVSPYPLNNTKKAWSTLAPKTIKTKRRRLRKGYLEPCFSTLPNNIVKADVTFKTEDGVTVEVDWPMGNFDRRGQPLQSNRVPSRGYRRQTAETKDLVQWCVHYKDQATVSDVSWHELHMKFNKVIPPLSWIQQERWKQNDFIPYQLEENARDGNGASRSPRDVITRYLMMPSNSHLIAEDEPVVSFRYGLDGRPQAKNTTIGAVMACITPVRDIEEARKVPRLVRDEFCVFLYSGKEDYEEQVRVGSRVFQEMNDLQENGLDLIIGHDEDGQEIRKHVKINWYIVSDWKALAEMMGIVGPTGHYFCILCYCTKDTISQFRQDYPLRSLEEARRSLADRRDTRGHRHLPVMKIPWGNVIGDTMHRDQRIGGKLLTQFIGWCIDQGVTELLEQAFREIGISTFYIRREATREGPSTYKWKTLSAKELKKAVRLLPDKMPHIIKDIGSVGAVRRIDSLTGPQLRTILRSKGVEVPHVNSERQARLKNLLGGAETVSMPGHAGEEDGSPEIKVEDIQKIWREFTRITDIPRNPELHASYKEAAKAWCENFRDTTYVEDCTPYIHYLGCHAADQLANHPFLHYINCETIEKKNHIQTRRYHLASQKGGGRTRSKWAEQLMQMENRELYAALHGIGQRKKRKYTKRAQPQDPDQGYGRASSSNSESGSDDSESGSDDSESGSDDSESGSDDSDDGDADQADAGVDGDESDDDRDDDDRIAYDGEEDDV
ncbi:Hypp5846 [Branchiostoma lanceolatum]|uniref:Hypp5846 protein n=1 Tax=Branchiostoma lanceolatum TaxID=7740 RepID=A0A8J9YSI1_BRALA|nr:Hypp5846 [Branchiostoma lanceolatum]